MSNNTLVLFLVISCFVGAAKGQDAKKPARPSASPAKQKQTARLSAADEKHGIM